MQSAIKKFNDSKMGETKKIYFMDFSALLSFHSFSHFLLDFLYNCCIATMKRDMNMSVIMQNN